MGLSEHRSRSTPSWSAYGLTLSDTRNTKEDHSGALIRQLLETAGARWLGHDIIREDPEAIRAALGIALEARPDVVITNGGTGMAPRDVAYDVLSDLFERPLPGFGELFRWLSYQEIGSASYLSRACAGVIGRTVLFSLPGSRAAVKLGMEKLILPELTHIVTELRRTRSGD